MPNETSESIACLRHGHRHHQSLLGPTSISCEDLGHQVIRCNLARLRVAFGRAEGPQNCDDKDYELLHVDRGLGVPSSSFET